MHTEVYEHRNNVGPAEGLMEGVCCRKSEEGSKRPLFAFAADTTFTKLCRWQLFALHSQSLHILPPHFRTGRRSSRSFAYVES